MPARASVTRRKRGVTRGRDPHGVHDWLRRQSRGADERMRLARGDWARPADGSSVVFALGWVTVFVALMALAVLCVS